MADRHEIQSILDSAGKRLGELAVSLKVDERRQRIGEIEKAMAAPDFWNDQESAQGLMEEMKSIKAVLDPVDTAREEVKDAKELFDLAVEEADAGTLDEVAGLAAGIPARIDSLDRMALLSGPHDEENCFFSIQVGAGGSDACEWAEMLLRMYTRYFDNKGWKTEELSFHPGDEAGVKSVDLRVAGPYAYGMLKSEIGVHRLVRISPFSGRRETSFAAIDVTPDFKNDIEIEIEDKDLRVDTYRSSGKGGQHVNKTDSAVRLTHIPSGIVVAVQNERSQHRNKDMALKILKARLLQREEASRSAAESARNAAKMDNAWGSQIRNYVLHPYTLVKDVRTGCETGNIQPVLDGDLDMFVDACLRWRLQETG